MAQGRLRHLTTAALTTLALSAPTAQAQFQTLPSQRPSAPQQGEPIGPEVPVLEMLDPQVAMALRTQLGETWFVPVPIISPEDAGSPTGRESEAANEPAPGDPLQVPVAGLATDPLPEDITETVGASGDAADVPAAGESDEATSQADQAGSSPSDDLNAAIAACRAGLDTVLGEQTLLFASGQTTLAVQSAQLLPSIADTLAQCPEAMVYVEGHTDSQGDAGLNLNLSIARAESVVDGLVELGIAPSRLFAVGYGASLPIADNGTAEGRRTNRRIVFAFQDIAEPQD